MYCVTVKFEIHPLHSARFRMLVGKQAEASLKEEPGCHVFDVWTSDRIPDQIYLYEVYTDRAAFELHLASDHFRGFDDDVRPLAKSKTVTCWDQKL